MLSRVHPCFLLLSLLTVITIQPNFIKAQTLVAPNNYELDTVSRLILNKLLKSPGQLFEQGMGTLHNGDIESAEYLFRKSLKRSPEYFMPLLGLAQIAMLKNRRADAAAYIQRARNVAPQNVSVLLAWGRFLMQTDKFNEAEWAFKKAEKLDLELTSSVLFDLGDLYLKAYGKPEDALVYYQKALQQNPENPLARFAAGIAYGAMGEYEQAKKSLQAALVADPENEKYRLALSRVVAAMGDTSAALAIIDSAKDKRSETAASLVAKGELHAGQNDFGNALAAFQAALEIDPAYGTALTKMGILYHKSGDLESARTVYLRAIEIDSTQSIAFNNLAFLATTRKDGLDSALNWALAATRLSPDTPEFFDTLGWVYRALGDLQSARETLEKAIQLHPEAERGPPGMCYRLGVVYMEMGERKHAVNALERAIRAGIAAPEADDAAQRLAELKRKSY